jgi:hypothetical protein
VQVASDASEIALFGWSLLVLTAALVIFLTLYRNEDGTLSVIAAMLVAGMVAHVVAVWVERPALGMAGAASMASAGILGEIFGRPADELISQIVAARIREARRKALVAWGVRKDGVEPAGPS